MGESNILAWVCRYPSQSQRRQDKNHISFLVNVFFSSKKERAINACRLFMVLWMCIWKHGYRAGNLYLRCNPPKLDCVDPLKSRGFLSVQARSDLPFYYSQIPCFKWYALSDINSNFPLLTLISAGSSTKGIHRDNWLPHHVLIKSCVQEYPRKILYLLLILYT